MAIESGLAEELRGRVALVTGVGRRVGIGAAIARELAVAGADLFISYFHAYDGAQPWGADTKMPGALLAELRQRVQVEAGSFDLAQPNTPEVLLSAALRRFGRVDILVNNAAHWEAGGADRVDAAQLDRHYAVNTRAPVLLCAELARRHPSGQAGRIINITSGQSRSAMPGELAYAVTKAALDALTLTLAAELAPRGITVNAIDPGPTDTGWMSQTAKSELEQASPTGTVADPRDVARLVRLLAREEAATISGQVLRVQPSARL